MTARIIDNDLWVQWVVGGVLLICSIACLGVVLVIQMAMRAVYQLIETVEFKEW